MGWQHNGKKKNNSMPGGFAGVPRIVMDHEDYQQLSTKSKALLLDLAYQYRGQNNGDLTVAFSVMRGKGWKREATLSEAVKELLAANLIIRTRQGRFTNPGAKCALYAITWQPINECKGKNLDIGPTITPTRKFSLEATI
jgi:hypothetical protein